MSWGADEVVVINGAVAEEDVARAVSAWARETVPWAILAPSTAWGREVASRGAAALGSGLTGDAVGLEERGGRLVAWKPAFGGQLLASIEARSSTQMATVRIGVLPQLQPRRAEAPKQSRIITEARGRVTVLKRTRDDDVDVLAEAQVVVGVGQGVSPGEYTALQPLLEVLGAQLGATRKVTDKGWLPRSRQIGITGRTIAPRLYVAIATSGKFNHMVGVRAAATVLAINADPDATVLSSADVGMVGDWHEVVPALVNQLSQLPTAT
jgi:electron transfer flavoprotein alpha subunit